MRFGTGSGVTRAGKNDFGFEEVAVCRYRKAAAHCGGETGRDRKPEAAALARA